MEAKHEGLLETNNVKICNIIIEIAFHFYILNTLSIRIDVCVYVYRTHNNNKETART